MIEVVKRKQAARLAVTSRSGWNFLIKIGCAGGALERVSIRGILLICWNPNKPHHGAARRTDWLFYRGTGKEIVVKGATGDLIG